MQDRIFLAEYEFEEKFWGLDFHAKDWEEAKAKLQALKETATLSGELKEVIPVYQELIKDQKN